MSSSPGSVGLARAHPLTKTQAMEPSRQTWSSYGPPYPLGRWSSSYFQLVVLFFGMHIIRASTVVRVGPCSTHIITCCTSVQNVGAVFFLTYIRSFFSSAVSTYSSTSCVIMVRAGTVGRAVGTVGS